MPDFDFDLDAIDTVGNADTGVPMPIKQLDGTPLKNKKGDPVGLVMLGADGEVYRRATRALTRTRLTRAAERKVEGPPTDQELDVQNADGIDVLAQMTAGWFGFIDKAGKDIAFGREGVVDLLKRFPIVRDQAEAFIADRSRFTKA